MMTHIPTSGQAPAPTLRGRLRTWSRRAAAGGLVLSMVGGVGYARIRPALGSVADGARLERMQQSPQWKVDRFENKQETVSDLFSGPPASEHQSPDDAIPTERRTLSDYQSAPESGLRVTWLGHSTMLVEIDGHRVLTDPIFSERASPVPFAGPKRWTAPPLPLEELPAVDAVVISHDHYDHLDYETVEELRTLDTTWVVPLGVGAHLEYWGIEASRIVELDWWEAHQLEGLTLTATPARHFSGRTTANPQGGPTLWCGFAMTGPQHRVYYSGDTGLFDELVDIGERLGPFDLTMMETGAYSQSARDIHLGPEQAVLAHKLVGGEVMLPVHWGLFDLNAHGWTAPIERALVAGEAAGVAVVSVRPGSMFEPEVMPTVDRWWPASVPWRTAEEEPIEATGVTVGEDRR